MFEACVLPSMETEFNCTALISLNHTLVQIMDGEESLGWKVRPFVADILQACAANSVEVIVYTDLEQEIADEIFQ